MNLISRLVSKSLRKRNPQLDFKGSDTKVLCIACQDLLNYLKVHWGITEQDELKEKIRSYFYEEPKELEEFVHLWTGIWIKKWNERVKVIPGNKNFQRYKKADRLVSKADPVWRKIEQRNEINDLVIENLVRNGEICGTSILAENLLKMEIGRSVKRKRNLEEVKCLLDIVNNVLRKTRQVSQNKGPLIFVRIQKRFFRLLQEDLK